MRQKSRRYCSFEEISSEAALYPKILDKVLIIEQHYSMGCFYKVWDQFIDQRECNEI